MYRCTNKLYVIQLEPFEKSGTSIEPPRFQQKACDNNINYIVFFKSKTSLTSKTSKSKSLLSHMYF